MIKTTPIKAIRAKCLECSNYQPKEVRNCLIIDCPLFPYRFGKNPNRKGIRKNIGSFSQKQSTQLTIP